MMSARPAVVLWAIRKEHKFAVSACTPALGRKLRANATPTAAKSTEALWDVGHCGHSDVQAARVTRTKKP